MENKEFAKLLEERTKRLAIDIIRLSASLPDTPENRVIRYQLSKSGTSIGANYREANRSRSKADFKSKIRICESEASETLYWLELIMEVHVNLKQRVSTTMKEVSEILAILTSISRNLSSN
ncbi:MAG: four helix bundle protein [Bacteroidota bacterium]|nr:four helix bundle protein [Bacteroidota bacterium]